MHYFVLTTMFWMGVEARHMYITLVSESDRVGRKFMIKAGVFAWGELNHVKCIDSDESKYHTNFIKKIWNCRGLKIFREVDWSSIEWPSIYPCTRVYL